MKRVAILVSKSDHCLYDLLIRHQSGELACDVACVISNHPDLERVASQFSVPFHHVPIENTRAVAEPATPRPKRRRSSGWKSSSTRLESTSLS